MAFNIVWFDVPSQRRCSGRVPTEKVVLTGGLPVYSTGAFEDTWVAWLQNEREARLLAEASPQ